MRSDLPLIGWIARAIAREFFGPETRLALDDRETEAPSGCSMFALRSADDPSFELVFGFPGGGSGIEGDILGLARAVDRIFAGSLRFSAACDDRPPGAVRRLHIVPAQGGSELGWVRSFGCPSVPADTRSALLAMMSEDPAIDLPLSVVLPPEEARRARIDLSAGRTCLRLGDVRCRAEQICRIDRVENGAIRMSAAPPAPLPLEFGKGELIEVELGTLRLSISDLEAFSRGESLEFRPPSAAPVVARSVRRGRTEILRLFAAGASVRIQRAEETEETFSPSAR